MKRTFVLLISLLLILTACGNKNEQDKSEKNESSQKTDSNNVKQIATDKDVQGDNYRTILPFKES